MKKDEPPLIFPKTLEEFEYAFNEHGQLRHTKTGEPFIFNHKEGMHRWNQKRYEALGEDLSSGYAQIITQYVYELLEKDCKLRKEMLPVDATENEPKSFVYLSEDALTNQDKLLVLIQGSGVVRAGQWARRLIINQDLDSGTQIPFITKAMQPSDVQCRRPEQQFKATVMVSKWQHMRQSSLDLSETTLQGCRQGGFNSAEGYGVIVLNPNENALEVEKVGDPSADAWDEPAEKRERKEECEGKQKKDGHEKYRNPQKERETKRIPIRENSSPEEHTLYVWDHFISRSPAKNIFVVAHSYGGLSFVELSHSPSHPDEDGFPLLSGSSLSFFLISSQGAIHLNTTYSKSQLLLQISACHLARKKAMIQREEEVMSRVHAVAMTDSVHNVWHQEASRSTREWLKERCCNWVSSPEPLDTPVDSLLPDCRRRSAGMSLYCSRSSIASQMFKVKMGRGSPIPSMLRRKIVEQYQKGVSQRKIAKSLKLSSSTVHNIIQRFRESRTISVRKGQGRKTILDARDLRALRRHCITYRNATVMEITTWAQEYFQKTLSVNTIHRAIRRCRLKLYRSKKKPYLNMIQKRRRFLWAKAHLKWTVAKWKTVLWSDESKFEVLFGKLGRHVIRTKEDKDSPSCYQRSVQKPASLMVWGCMSACGMGSLHIWKGTINAERVKASLEPCFIIKPLEEPQEATCTAMMQSAVNTLNQGPLIPKAYCNVSQSTVPSLPIRPSTRQVARILHHSNLGSGTEKHELTSWSSFKSIFRFFDEHLQSQMEEGRVEEQKEEQKEEEQKEEQNEEVKEEQKDEEEDGSTTVTTQKRAKHEDL
ncbi:hypothetical protein QTP70_021513 [Hemibagrus guttatus]|uniref:Protein FAM172A n=1 Tax=Hemibagrus guttatus TaxID=175788 RepID=A0AAE0Q6I5_9TELE|nr:hypothetical protein QTP70_021513 [Hemibagrus guttatus]